MSHLCNIYFLRGNFPEKHTFFANKLPLGGGGHPSVDPVDPYRAAGGFHCHRP